MKKIVIVNRGAMPSEDLLTLLKMVFPECEITGAFVLEGEVEPSFRAVSLRMRRSGNRDRRTPSKRTFH